MPTKPYPYHDKLIIAHAVFGGIAVMILMPAAVLVARFLRRNPVWYNIHSLVNWTALLFIIISFALGTHATGSGGHPGQFIDSRTDLHHRIGLGTTVLMICQAFIGLAAHFTKSPVDKPTVIFTKGRSVFRLFHILVGIALVGTAYATVYIGFGEWDDANKVGTVTPRGVHIVFWILLAAAVAAYLAGCVLGSKAVQAPAETRSVEDEDMTEKKVNA